MIKERIKAKVSDLILNEGQLGWLPTNPRQWTQTDIDRTKKSLETDVDFQEDKPIMVVRHEDKLLVFAGNLRTTAAKALKWETFDAMLYTPETEEDRATIKRRAILDNGSFGDWDMDMLANEWDDLPLREWGIDMPDWGTANVGEQEDTAHKDEMDKGYNIQYVMVFNNEDEQDRWYSFLEILKRKYPDVDTIAERVLLETDEIVRNAN